MLDGFFGADVTYIISQAFALAAALASICAIQQKKKIQIINYGVLNAFFGFFHYALLGAWSGVAIKTVSIVRNATAAYEVEKRKKSKVLAFVFVGLFVAGGILTYESIFSALPIIATSVYTVALYLADAKRIRYASLFGSTLWLVYDFHVMTVVGIITEALFIVNDLIAIRRFRKRKRSYAQKKTAKRLVVR